MGGSDVSLTKNVNVGNLAGKSPCDTAAIPNLRSQFPTHIKKKVGTSPTIDSVLAKLGDSKVHHSRAAEQRLRTVRSEGVMLAQPEGRSPTAQGLKSNVWPH